MSLADTIAELRCHDPCLAERIAPLRNLEQLLAWIPQCGIPLSRIDLVAQDEYSYDLLVPLCDSSRWLVHCHSLIFGLWHGFPNPSYVIQNGLGNPSHANAQPELLAVTEH